MRMKKFIKFTILVLMNNSFCLLFLYELNRQINIFNTFDLFALAIYILTPVGKDWVYTVLPGCCWIITFLLLLRYTKIPEDITNSMEIKSTTHEKK